MKSILRKHLIPILFITVLTVLAAITPIRAEAATVKAKLNTKAVELTIGTRTAYQLELINATGKITWKSADKAIAKVDKNGLVTAISAGTTKITAKCQGKSYKCTVTVNPLPGKRTTKKYTYLKGDKVDVFLDKDVTYYETIVSDIEAVMDWLEKETGLSFYPKDTYWINNNRSIGFRKLYLGTDPWSKYPEDSTKVSVYFFTDRDDKGWSNVSLGNSIILTSNKANFYDSECGIGVLAHELAHCIQSRNGAHLKATGDKFAEGYGAYFEVKADCEMTRFPSSEDTQNRYGRFFSQITVNNIETLCTADFDEIFGVVNDEEYALGYLLTKYIFEEHGKTSYNKFLKTVSSTVRKQYHFASTVTESISALKKALGKKVLSDFVSWYDKNYDNTNCFGDYDIFELCKNFTKLSKTIDSSPSGSTIILDYPVFVPSHQALSIPEEYTLKLEQNGRIFCDDLGRIYVSGTIELQNTDSLMPISSDSPETIMYVYGKLLYRGMEIKPDSGNSSRVPVRFSFTGDGIANILVQCDTRVTGGTNTYALLKQFQINGNGLLFVNGEEIPSSKYSVGDFEVPTIKALESTDWIDNTIEVTKPENVLFLTTTDYTYIRGKRVDLYLDKNVHYSNSLLYDIEYLMTWLEKDSKLSFYPEYSVWVEKNNTTFDRTKYYNCDPWPEHSGTSNRLSIYIVGDRNNVIYKYSSGNSAVISAILVDRSGIGYQVSDLVRLLACQLISRNAYTWMCSPDTLIYGFAEYYSEKADNELPEYANIMNLKYGIDRTHFSEPITEENVEKLFAMQSSISPKTAVNPGLYGYFIVKYMMYNYGSQKFSEFIDAFAHTGKASAFYAERYSAEIEELKKCYGDSFFTDFLAWFNRNYDNPKPYSDSERALKLSYPELRDKLKECTSGTTITIDYEVLIPSNYFLDIPKGVTLELTEKGKISFEGFSGLSIKGTLKLPDTTYIPYSDDFYQPSDVRLSGKLIIGDTVIEATSDELEKASLIFLHSDRYLRFLIRSDIKVTGEHAEETMSTLVYVGSGTIYFNGNPRFINAR